MKSSVFKQIIYIISDFKKLNYTNNIKCAVYSHIKGLVNSRRGLKWASLMMDLNIRTQPIQN